jgi:hypothetical protein
MDKPAWAKYRQEQLASANGEILEIGVGTGLNLPHYPEHVQRITTADPNPGMNKKLQRASVTPTFLVLIAAGLAPDGKTASCYLPSVCTTDCTNGTSRNRF